MSRFARLSLPIFNRSAPTFTVSHLYNPNYNNSDYTNEKDTATATRLDEGSGIKVLWKLEEKASLVDWRKGDRKEWFVLFSIHGFTDDLVTLAKERHDLILLS